MAIDITREKLFLLLTGIKMTFDRNVSSTTAWRWVYKGIGGRKLEVVRLGNKTYTSLEALQRFALQQGGADAPEARTPSQRQKAIERAERELSDDGII